MKLIKSFFIVAMVSYLAGCAAGIQNTRIDANKPLPLSHGVVAVQIVNNTEQLQNFHKGWTEVIAVRVDNQEELKALAVVGAKEKAKKKGEKFDESKVDWEPDFFSLTPFNEGVIDSQIFIGSMPEGQYMITSLYSFYSDGNMSSWISMPVFYSTGHFSVVAKQLTSLGTIAFQPLLSIKAKSFWSNSSSQKAFVTRLADQQSIDSYVQSHYPSIASQLSLNEINTWQDDELDTFRIKLGELARENAYSSHDIGLSEVGKGALAARFGQLRLLDQAGSWRQLDLPTNAQLSSAVEFQGRLYIGGERGQLFFSPIDELDNWQSLSPVNAKEAIIWLGKGEQGIFALTKSTLQYTAYFIPDMVKPWQKIGEISGKGKSFWVVNGGVHPFITQAGELRVINDNEIHDYNLVTNTWSKKKGTTLAKLSQNNKGVLLALEVSQWDGIGDQLISLNDGDDWITVKRNLQLFGDNKTEGSFVGYLEGGLVVTLGRVKNTAGKSELRLISKPVSEVSNSSDWQIGGVAQTECQKILPNLSSENKVYFLCDQGKVISTADLGVTWQDEVRINIAQMQKQYEQLMDSIKQQNEQGNPN